MSPAAAGGLWLWRGRGEPVHGKWRWPQTGAAVGIMKFGNEDFGPDPANWETAKYGTVGNWMTAAQVTKGDLSAWEFVQVWA